MELASEFESDLQDTVNLSKKWIVYSDDGKAQLASTSLVSLVLLM